MSFFVALPAYAETKSRLCARKLFRLIVKSNFSEVSIFLKNSNVYLSLKERISLQLQSVRRD